MKILLVALFLSIGFAQSSYAVTVPELNSIDSVEDVDEFYIIDKSDLSDGDTGTGKKIKISDFLSYENVISHGALPYDCDLSSAGDSSTAFQAALETGKPVVIPAMGYDKTCYSIESDIMVPDRAILIGWGGQGYGTSFQGNIVLRDGGVTNAVLDLSGAVGFRLEGFEVDGVDRDVNCIAAINDTAHHGTIRNVTVRDCDVGIGGVSASYFMSATKILSSTATQNNNGIAYITDSHAYQNVIAGSHQDGVFLGSGNNDNTFIGNKVEWNKGHGFHLYDTDHNNIVGGVIDRNYKSGVYFNASSYATLSGSILRRNGRNAASGEDSHIILNATSNVVIDGIVTRTGQDDGGGGVLSPAYTLRNISTSTDLVLSNSDLQGYVTSVSTGAFGSDYIISQNLGKTSDISGQDINLSNGRIYQSKGSVASILNAATNAVALSAFPINTYARAFGELKVVIRVPATGATYAASFDLIFKREGGNASIDFSDAKSEIGTAGAISLGGSGAIVDIVFSNVASNGSSFDVEITNNSGNTVSVWVELK